MAHDFEKKWRSADVRLQENVDFNALLLSDRVLTGLTDAGFKKPSPIQLQAIPMGRFGKDLLVQAKSGTGKTLVFVIVALEMLKRKLFRPQVLVLVPTREIATQICAVVKSVGSTFPKLICNSFIGGMPLADDREKAVMSQIVVGTPGRLKQLIQMQALPINSIRLLVFDEADQLLEASFKEDIAEIFNLLPEDKQVIATSATYPPKLKQMMMKYLRDPHEACLSEKQIALLGMVHYVKVVEFCPMPILQHKSKLAALEVILKKVKFSQCLLFCNGVLKVEVLYKDIKKWGFSTAYISSAKEQTDRLKAIDRLKHFKCKVLVSSDLTARGIDAENVDLVVNFDVTPTYETYMHRVGRAGRYGSVGVAITIVDEKEIKFIQKIEEAGGFKSYKLPDPVPLDLVLHPSKGEYVIPEAIKNTSNSENGEKFYVPDDKIENGIDIDSANNSNTENVKLEHVSNANLKKEISIYSETDDKIENNVLQAVKNGLDTKDEELDFISSANGRDSTNFMCKPALESTSTTKSSSSAVECTSIKSDIEQDTTCAENCIASYNENYKIINYNEEKKEVAFSEAQSRNKIDILSNFLENESSNLQSDCISTTVIDNPSPNKIDSDENLYELCSEEFQQSPENQNSVSGMENIEVTSELRSNFKSDDLIKSEIESSNEEADHVFEIKDAEVSVSANDADLNSKKENDTGLAQNLNFVIRTFVDNYEENKNTGSTDSDNTNEMHADSEKKAISLDMIKDLNIRKNEYFYKLFKKYENEHLIPCSKDNVEEKGDALSKSLKKEVVENDNPVPVIVSEENSSGLITVEIDNPAPVIVSEENSMGLTALTESSEIKGAENLPGKPSYESTPHHSEKSKLQIIKTVVSESKIKMEKQNKLLQLFQESSDESDSSDSKLSDNSSSNQSSSSDESESSFDSSDSESDSESSSVSSSDDETSDSVIKQSRGEHLTNSRHQFQSRGESHRVAYRNVDEDHYRRGYSVPYTCTSSRNQTIAREEPCRVGDHRDNGRYRYQRKYSRPPAHKCDSFSQKIDTLQNHQKHSKYAKPKRSDYYPNCCTRTNCHPQQLPGSQYFSQSIPQFPALPTCMNREMHSVPSYCSDVHQNHTGQGCSHRHFQAGGSCRSEHQNKDYYRREHSQSDWRHYPDLNCCMPSDHRCHPDTSDYACSHGQICAMWYEEFRKQWLYIQNVMNG